MDKQKQIEEMATEIARTILSCPLNQGRHCDLCKFNDKDTISYDCQSYLVAEKLLEKYQPKIPENAVVLTPAERDEEMRLIREDVIARMGATRKETAEKFAKLVDDKSVYFNMGNGDIYKVVHFEDVNEICKEITEGVKYNGIYNNDM